MPPVVVGRMYIDNALFQLPATVGGDNIDITEYDYLSKALYKE